MSEQPIEMLRNQATRLKELRHQLAHQAAYKSWQQTITEIYQCSLAILRIVLWHADKRTYVLKYLDHDEVDQIVEIATELNDISKWLEPEQAFQKVQGVLRILKDLSCRIERALGSKTDDSKQYLRAIVSELQIARDRGEHVQWLGILKRMRSLALRQKMGIGEMIATLQEEEGQAVTSQSLGLEESKQARRRLESRVQATRYSLGASSELIETINRLLQREAAYPDLGLLAPSALDELLDARASGHAEVLKKAYDLSAWITV